MLGNRSGYLKGFGVRAKSSLAPSQNQTTTDSEVQKLRQQVAEQSQKTTFLENLVLQLAQRAGIDPNTVVGADGTSGGDKDATSPGLYTTTLISFGTCFLLLLISFCGLGLSIIWIL